MLDVIIRDGEIVDGSGGPRRRADVGVRDGRIVSVGKLSDHEADLVVDARGKVVTPGFVDVHTHYDAEVFWDSSLAPSPLHGVTTAFAGNCGFAVAPLSGATDDRDYLMRMLARVEGMPLTSLHATLPWSWRSAAEYFSAIDGTLGINLGFMVGHSVLRRVVMGEAANQRAASRQELTEIGRLLHESLDAGAVGFSSSWARTHTDAEGLMVPSRLATREELVELCRIVAAHEGTGLEFIPMIGDFEPWALELMADMSAAAQRPLNWNVLSVNSANEEERHAKLAAAEVARQRGGRVVALTIPMTFSGRLSFASGFVLDTLPGWAIPMSLPLSAKRELFRDRDARRALNNFETAEAGRPWSSYVIFDVVADENQAFLGRTVGEIAAERGEDPWDVLCDIAVADDLYTSFGRPAPPASRADWMARAETWRDPRALIGGSDAGAHLDFLAAFNYSTTVLAEGVREHQVVTLEEAVHLLSDAPARLYGVKERGRIELGWHADLVVFDPDTVASEEVTLRRDLPSGGGRLYAGAKGIDYVLVNGAPIVARGTLTGARAGRLLRSGLDTSTPDVV